MGWESVTKGTPCPLWPQAVRLRRAGEAEVQTQVRVRCTGRESWEGAGAGGREGRQAGGMPGFPDLHTASGQVQGLCSSPPPLLGPRDPQQKQHALTCHPRLDEFTV